VLDSMLIIQIALGIVVGFLMLAYLPQILALSIWVVLGSMLLVAIVLAIIFFKEILTLLVIPLALAFGYGGGMGLYLLVSFIYPKIKETKTTLPTCFATFAILNFFLVATIYDTLPFSHALHAWSFENGFKDAVELAFIGVLCLWAWIPVSLRYYLKRKTLLRLLKCKIEFESRPLCILKTKLVLTIEPGPNQFSGLVVFAFLALNVGAGQP
jgi:hypothetical protein